MALLPSCPPIRRPRPFWSFVFHPRDAVLDAFADGRLPPAARARVAAHLEHCTSCRGAVAFRRRLDAAALAEPWPAPRPELLDRVLARRAAGERAIVPADAPTIVPTIVSTADASQATPRQVPPAVPNQAVARRGLGTSFGTSLGGSLAAAACLCVAALGVLTRRDAAASDPAGELRVAPALPTSGARLAVDFRPSLLLAGHTRLLLRATLRTPLTGAYAATLDRRVVAELSRGDNGHFRGTFVLPDSVVYAEFSVEDSSGQHVDANGAYEVLTADGDGRPSWAALEAKKDALLGRNWEAAYATAREQGRLYPDDPRSWHSLLFYEGQVLGPRALDTLRLQHAARFRTFHARLAVLPRVPAQTMGAMFFYGSAVGDSVARDYWRARLAREAPADPYTVQNRMVDIASRVWRRDSVAALAAYDALWRDVADVPGALTRQGAQLPRLGFDAALRVGDLDATRRWAARYAAVSPANSFFIAAALTRVPALRPQGLAWMRAVLRGAETPDDARRPLTRTRAEHAVQTRRRYAALLGEYGQALMRAGERTAGADTLALAASLDWTPELARQAAEARLALGDTTRALRWLARVTVEPATPDSVRQWVRALVRPRVAAATWRAWQDSAATEMRQQVLAQATRTTLRGPVRLTDSAGAEVTLDRLTGRQPSVVVFWSAHCGPAIAAVPGIQRLAAALASRHVPLVVISEDSLTAADRAVLARGAATFPVYVDARREAQRAFSNFGTPAYHVLDGAGSVRFAYASVEELPRQLAVLDPPPAPQAALAP